MKYTLRPFAAAAALILAATAAPAAAPKEIPLSVDPKILAEGGDLWGKLPFYNDPVALSPEKPAGVKKAPAANGTLAYGSIKAGNGPRSSYLVAVDQEPEGKPELRRIYVDTNQNGDLSDDGDGQWQKQIARGKVTAGTHTVLLRASYGTAEKETASGDYSVLFIYTIWRLDAGYQLSQRRAAGRVGQIDVDGKSVRLVLIENDNDARFDRFVATGDKPRPFWLMADLDGDGQFDPYTEKLDARQPVKLGSTTYDLSAPIDGSRLTLTPTTKVAQAPGQKPAAGTPAPRQPLLAAGTVAPDFTALTADNKPVKLSDFRGKVVLVDFWAPWCGPCKASMPYVESLHQKAGNQDFVVLGVCVWEARANFDKWMVEPQVKTSYLKIFDPAERGDDNIAKKLYNVSGIPTFYVVGKDGKVIEGFVGNSPANKAKLTEILQQNGLEI
jgi:thiol-disulfide isomerase/thioredoxin